MLSLSTDADGIADSDQFAMVYNFGLEEAKFEEGVEAFAGLVPEPSSAMLFVLAIFGALPLVRRTRHRTTS